jgi:hypothetical protein
MAANSLEEQEYVLFGENSEMDGCNIIAFPNSKNISSRGVGTGMISNKIVGFFNIRMKAYDKFSDLYELTDADVPFHIRQSVE